MDMFNKHFMIIGLVAALALGCASYTSAIQSLSEDELDRITAQDGATFVLENFDFFVASPGIQYLDAQGFDTDGPGEDSERGYITFEDLTISNGNYGPVIMSTNMDWDIYSQTLNGVDYNYNRFAFYNTFLTMDLDVEDIKIAPLTASGPIEASIGGLHIDDLSIDRMNLYLGAASNNTGVAGEIDISLQADGLTVDAFRHLSVDRDTPITLENIMIAGYFTGSEPDCDGSKPLPYTDTPGLWSEARALSYAGGVNEYYYQLIAANRWVPDPASWVPHGMLKIGDVESGNPLRMDFTVDTNSYIPFPYDIVSGEPSQDDRVEWYEPASGEFFSDARGWRDGKDNYLQDGTDSVHFWNPRYNKPYVSIDTPISGSIRVGESDGDLLIVDGINLQIHVEIPGYGYGDTPNSIPRPFPDPDLQSPRYDEPFDTYWRK
jgi:hypothetical protein